MLLLNNNRIALPGATQWVECLPANQRVAGLIPGHGACLGCGPGVRWGVQPVDVSLTHFSHTSTFLSLSKNK